MKPRNLSASWGFATRGRLHQLLLVRSKLAIHVGTQKRFIVNIHDTYLWKDGKKIGSYEFNQIRLPGESESRLRC